MPQISILYMKICKISWFEQIWICFMWWWTGEKKPINSQLWHACAGPLVSLPPVGSLVVYFPQGHSEQVRSKRCFIAFETFDSNLSSLNPFQVAASMQKQTDFIPNYPNLPSKLICLLHSVTLHVSLFCLQLVNQNQIEEKRMKN